MYGYAYVPAKEDCSRLIFPLLPPPPPLLNILLPDEEEAECDVTILCVWVDIW